MRIILLTLLTGALGGLARQRSLRGLVPGTVLAGALLWIVGGRLLRKGLPLDTCTGLSILIIGSSQALFAGERRGIPVDVPLDSRLAIVVLTGLFLRGAALIVRALTTR